MFGFSCNSTHTQAIPGSSSQLDRRHLRVYHYHVNVSTSDNSVLLIVLAVALVAVLAFTLGRRVAPQVASQQQQYNNDEIWDIEWSPDGLPLKVHVKRDAKTGPVSNRKIKMVT